MLASASAQANVLWETWAQNLDLTTPSSEMPLTSVLDSKDKQEIMMGWTCCYQKELINSVQREHSQKLTALTLRENPKRLLSTLQLREQYTDLQMATFVALQFLDIYTTYRGLKYDCVWEMNPILGDKPSVGNMMLTKTAILAPAIQSDIDNERLTKNVMSQMNMWMGLVILNNWDTVQSAEQNCNKRK